MSNHHKFHYLEFPATDLAAMKDFYGAAFGWKFKDWGDAYVEIQESGVHGGFALATEERGPSNQGALVIIYSDDLVQSEKTVVECGGEISMAPIDFPGGRRFHFLDPSGNELGVWTEVPIQE
ncbi:VOC family protein [Mariniblastus fucicola]|uniref:Glyoxalase-like domain protein n=1 Tax=Mariniblastus fucicola TaxID=980251 RepID=A0A5B9P1K9_9BACT|nr:VOC family protein [Mariniblastus fucicola]QEG20198.1 Glyoxalase-like domain protein [Mariniblastus fucicola]